MDANGTYKKITWSDLLQGMTRSEAIAAFRSEFNSSWDVRYELWDRQDAEAMRAFSAGATTIDQVPGEEIADFADECFA